MATYYHVATEYDGGDLQSLYLRHGRDETAAIEWFCEHWTDFDPASAAYHIMYVHLHDTLEQAREFQSFFGGEILAIGIGEDDMVELERDTIEYDHAMVRDSIPAHLIRVI